jgi:plasmid stability protein
MTSLTIPNIDDNLKQRLMKRAVEHGRTMEIEAREILQDALVETQPPAVPDNLYDAIRAIVQPLGGIELKPIPRQPLREPPKFE